MPCRATKSFVGSILVQCSSRFDRYHRKLNSGVTNPKLIISKISVSHNRTSVPITQKKTDYLVFVGLCWTTHPWTAGRDSYFDVVIWIMGTIWKKIASFGQKLGLPGICWRDRTVNVHDISKQLLWSSIWKHKWRLSDFYRFHWLETLLTVSLLLQNKNCEKIEDKYQVCWESLWQADIRIVIHQAVSLVYIKIIKYMVFQSANLCLSNALAAAVFS